MPKLDDQSLMKLAYKAIHEGYPSVYCTSESRAYSFVVWETDNHKPTNILDHNPWDHDSPEVISAYGDPNDFPLLQWEIWKTENRLKNKLCHNFVTIKHPNPNWPGRMTKSSIKADKKLKEYIEAVSLVHVKRLLGEPVPMEALVVLERKE